MLEFLAGIDKVLFLWINVSLSNPVTDIIMPVLTSDQLLRVMYGAGLACLLWFGDRRLRWLALASAITLLLTDQLSSNLLKGLIARLRPCHLLTSVHLLVDCGAGYSMPSSHAANLFGQAALFYHHLPAARRYLLLLAVLVAVSRIFVGVHYPFDVLAGAILGILVGGVASLAFARVGRKWRQPTPR